MHTCFFSLFLVVLQYLTSKLIRFAFWVVLFVFVPSLSSAYPIAPSHPRLYFTAGDLQTLRGRTTTSHATQWQALRSWDQPDANAFATHSGRDATRTHRYIERNAFMYLMLAESGTYQGPATCPGC